MLPQFQYPTNALLDFSPVTNAFARVQDNSFRQAQLENERTRLGYEGERLGMEKGRFQREERDDKMKSLVGSVLAANQATDPVQRKALLDGILAQHPDPAMRSHPVFSDPMKGPQALMADLQAHGINPYALAQSQAGLQHTQAQTASVRGSEARAEAMAPLERGLKAREITDPQQKVTVIPEGGTAIITDTRNPNPRVIGGGTPKLTDAEKKQIEDADQSVASHQDTLSTLQRLSQLSKHAYGGLGATARAEIAANLGIREGEDTQILANEATQMAVGQLRATFGGNPTEGERKVLLDVQGSANQTDAVRQRIYANASEAVQQKLARDMRRAQQLRERTFFQPGGGVTGRMIQGPATGPQVTRQFSDRLPPEGGAQAAGVQGQIPPDAVRFLMSNPTPEMRQFFDQKYGAGRAAQFLQAR